MKVVPYTSKEDVLAAINLHGSFISNQDDNISYGIVSISEKDVCVLDRNMYQLHFSFPTLSESFIWSITKFPCGNIIS